MPAWALILLFIGALVLGYLGMDGLDRMLAGQAEETTPAREERVLLFGQEEEIFSAREWLQIHRLRYDEVEAPVLPPEGSYRLLLALSGSDMDNLFLCSAAKRRFPEVKTAARLTDAVYKPVFKDAGVDYILPPKGDNEVTELLKHVHPHAGEAENK